MTQKATNEHRFIARGIDQHSAIHSIPVGRSELQINFDTNSAGYIFKRKGYELHRNVPIRLVNVTDRGTSWELVAHPSVDLLGVPSGPIVVNGQAINTGTGKLKTVE